MLIFALSFSPFPSSSSVRTERRPSAAAAHPTPLQCRRSAAVKRRLSARRPHQTARRAAHPPERREEEEGAKAHAVLPGTSFFISFNRMTEYSTYLMILLNDY